VTLPPVDEAEVCDHLSLVLFVSELSKDGDGLLEMLDSVGFGAALSEGESEVVERQRLRSLVAEIANDREGEAMLLGRLLGLAAASKLCSLLVEPQRLTASVQGQQPVDQSGVGLTAPIDEDRSPARHSACPVSGVHPHALHVVAEPPGPTLRGPQRRPGRSEDGLQPLADSVTAQSPKPSRKGSDHEQQCGCSQHDDDERERSEESGQQEPEPTQCERATPHALSIRCHCGARSLITRSSFGAADFRLAHPRSFPADND
jgi:hypothetical protein